MECGRNSAGREAAWAICCCAVNYPGRKEKSVYHPEFFPIAHFIEAGDKVMQPRHGNGFEWTALWLNLSGEQKKKKAAQFAPATSDLPKYYPTEKSKRDSSQKRAARELSRKSYMEMGFFLSNCFFSALFRLDFLSIAYFWYRLRKFFISFLRQCFSSELY